MAETIFSKIIRREIPADIVFENDKVLAFKDIDPQAPFHVLVIPKEPVATLNEVKDFSLYADLFAAIQEITRAAGIQEKGYRVVANCNEYGGQAVYHLHLHVLGQRPMKWPPG